MSLKTFNVSEKAVEKLKSEVNKSALVNSLLLKHYAGDEAESASNPNGLDSQPKAYCLVCNGDKYLYFCERGHKSVFCYDCIIGREERKHGSYFKARCKRSTCNFIPFIDKEK